LPSPFPGSSIWETIAAVESVVAVTIVVVVVGTAVVVLVLVVVVVLVVVTGIVVVVVVVLGAAVVVVVDVVVVVVVLVVEVGAVVVLVVVVGGGEFCRRFANAATASISAVDNDTENAGIQLRPLVTTEAISGVLSVLSCSEGPRSPAPVGPWQAAHSAA
jgi:hypothetical protein